MLEACVLPFLLPISFLESFSDPGDIHLSGIELIFSDAARSHGISYSYRTTVCFLTKAPEETLPVACLKGTLQQIDHFDFLPKNNMQIELWIWDGEWVFVFGRRENENHWKGEPVSVQCRSMCYPYVWPISWRAEHLSPGPSHDAQHASMESGRSSSPKHR